MAHYDINIEGIINLVTSIAGGDTTDILKNVLAFGDKVPYVGVIVQAVSRLMSLSDTTPNPFVQIQNILDELCTKSIDMNQKLDNLINHVTTTSIIQDYKRKKEILDDLNDWIVRYSKCPNKRTKKDLIDKFKFGDVFSFINWLYKEMTTEKLQPITQMMLVDYDLNYFQNWSQRLVQDFTRAMLMHSYRIRLQSNDPDLEALNSDQTDFIEKFKEFSRKLNELDIIIRYWFWEKKAISEIEVFMECNQNLDQQSFSSELYKLLKKKYFWRAWAVASWTTPRRAFGNFVRTENSRSYVKFWQTNTRRVFVGSSTSENAEAFRRDIESTLSRVIRETPSPREPFAYDLLPRQRESLYGPNNINYHPVNLEDEAEKNREFWFGDVSEKLWKVIGPDTNGLVLIVNRSIGECGYAIDATHTALFQHVSMRYQPIVIAIAKDTYVAGSLINNFDTRFPKPPPSSQCVCL